MYIYVYMCVSVHTLFFKVRLAVGEMQRNKLRVTQF